MRETGMSDGTMDGSSIAEVDLLCIPAIPMPPGDGGAAVDGDIRHALVRDRRGAEKRLEDGVLLLPPPFDPSMTGTFCNPGWLLRRSRHPPPKPRLCDEPPREWKPGDGGGLPSNDVVDDPRPVLRMLLLLLLLLISPSLLDPFRKRGAENKLEDGRRSTGVAGPEFLQFVVKSAPRLPRRSTGA